MLEVVENVDDHTVDPADNNNQVEDEGWSDSDSGGSDGEEGESESESEGKSPT